jgi:hypothetical protein
MFAQNLLPFSQSELQKLFCGLKVLHCFRDHQKASSDDILLWRDGDDFNGRSDPRAVGDGIPQ